MTLKNAYHGDTIGSVSLGGIELFHEKFKPLLFDAQKAMSPLCLRCPHNKRKPRGGFTFYEYKGEDPKPGDPRPETGCRWECLKSAESILKKAGPRVTAAVVEPIVQGAGGMIVAPPGYLRGLSELCRKYGALLIADEVATGFGRTGRMFASSHESVAPDMVCVSKGITGGYLPLGATLTTEKIYRAFLGKYEEFKAFFHGHTYTANPLACEAARANLRIFERRKVLDKIQNTIRLLKDGLEEFKNLPLVGDVRQAGLMAGIVIVKDKKTLESFPPSARAGKRICMEARKHGILSRPLGDVLVLMPPLSISAGETRLLLEGMRRSILSFGDSILNSCNRSAN